VRPPGLQLTFHVSTNGLASGNHPLEAIEHGLCEALERDAVAMCQLEGPAGLLAHKVDEASVHDPDCKALLTQMHEAGLAVAIFDLSLHAGVPTFQVAAIDAEDRPSWRRLGAFWGYGTHLSADIALARALTEAAQSRLTIIAGSRDDNPYGIYSQIASDEMAARVRETIFRPPPRVQLADSPSRASESFEGDIEALIEAVRRLGLEQVVVVDLRKPELDIPVVKVIVPGLEVLAHGIPVAMGRRARAKRAASARR
jgi:ribosomal protein S12 methylthiotransferase accessory factor